jgi:hypothetical protein
VRTSFSRRVPAPAKVATGIVAVAMLGGAAYIVAVSGAWFGAAPLLVFALLAGFVLLGVRRTARRDRIEFTDSGVRLTARAVAMTVPWSDIERWALTDHHLLGARLPRPGLCAYPTAGVDPTAGDLRLIWSATDGCWLLCDVPSYDVTPEDLVAAAGRFASNT